MSDRSDRRTIELRAQRARFIEASIEEGEACCCDGCGCCNFRCWAIVLLVLKILGNVAMVVFGGWAIHGWRMGEGFGVVILLVSIISLCIHIMALYGVVHGLANFIYLGFIFEIIKLFFDFIYGVILGAMVTAHYFGSAVFYVIWDIFVIWILWRVYQTAKSVER